jgi:hypothetical protein
MSRSFRRAILLAGVTAGVSAAMSACGSAPVDTVPRGNGGSTNGGTGNPSTGGTLGGNTGGTSNVIIPDSGNGGTGPLGDSACAKGTFQGEEVPFDMFIMLDQSGSMNQGNPGPWGPVTDAFRTFVQAPESAGIGVGIQYFPLAAPTVQCISNNNPPGCVCIDIFIAVICNNNAGGSCVVNDYGTPDVPIQPLPAVEPAITASLAAHNPGGGTPTYPALQGAMQYAVGHATGTGRKTIVVLATDGAPNDCNSDVTNVSQVAAAGFNSNPSIQTFVIGIGNTGNLNQIAQAGGTGQAIIVNTNTAGQDFLNAMNQIRGRALTCTFTMPTPDSGETVNPSEVNVYYTPPGGTTEVIYGVASEAQCDPAVGGWYYDDPANPTEIRACPTSCDRLTSVRGQIDLELGCTTLNPPQ